MYINWCSKALYFVLRYVHYIMESAQYLYMNIAEMNGFFNWTMTYRRDSDFYRPYGRVVKAGGLGNDQTQIGSSYDCSLFNNHVTTFLKFNPPPYAVCNRK